MSQTKGFATRFAALGCTRAWIGVLALALVAAKGWAQTYEILHVFKEAGLPTANLIQGADGFLYGTTSRGGKSGVGTVFRIDSQSNVSTLHSFGYADGAFPLSALVQGTDGDFYGTTQGGGDGAMCAPTFGCGTVFKIDSSGNLTTLYKFSGKSDGSHPSAALIQATDGYFYGTTSQSIFRVGASGSFTTLSSTIGTKAALLQASDGNFYGTTTGCGEFGQCYMNVFKMDFAGNVTGVASLPGSSDAALIQATDNEFYGTISSSTILSPKGRIFRIDSLGNVVTLHTFNGSDGGRPQAALTQGSDGDFYGTTSIYGANGFGTVFKMDASGNLTTLHVFGNSDGGHPLGAPLIQAADGNFYGTTSYGEPNPHGTVFQIDSSGTFTTLHSFGPIGPIEGTVPYASLIQAIDGSLYGTAYQGGASDTGTVLKVSSTGKVTTLHNFDGNDGAYPVAPLIQATDGHFYGTTSGLNLTYGSVFRIDSSGILTLLHSFNNSDGANPLAGLIQAADGNLYGTTSEGGTFGYGTVYKIDSSGTLTMLYSFKNSDGANPVAGLVQATDGTFYGTTRGANINSDACGSTCGTVFKMDSSGALTTLHIFDGSDGAFPEAGLIQATDGSFYGTTSRGGLASETCAGCGTVFKIDSQGALTTLHDFDGSDGAYPYAPLLQATDGSFYGTTTYLGAVRSGTVFKMDFSGNITTLYTFIGTDGYSSRAALIQTKDGTFYGTAPYGGPGDAGVVFRLTSSSIAVNGITPTSGPATGGSAVAVLGGGFDAGASMTIGGAAATDLTISDSAFLYALSPSLSPGTLNDVTVTNSGNAPNSSGTIPNGFFADFLDVPQSDIFHDYVEKIFRAGITAGCGGGDYCRNNPVRRDQMAVFLLKAEHGSAYVPPACTGVFPDVPCPGQFTDWVEQLAAEQITGGCGGGNYCPTSPVTRAQMAVFLLRTEQGPSYTPPPCAGIFGDVSCPSRFADWIEQLHAEKVTGGCQSNPLLYCPGNAVTHGQMAVFLVKTFGLQ